MRKRTRGTKINFSDNRKFTAGKNPRAHARHMNAFPGVRVDVKDNDLKKALKLLKKQGHKERKLTIDSRKELKSRNKTSNR